MSSEKFKYSSTNSNANRRSNETRSNINDINHNNDDRQQNGQSKYNDTISMDEHHHQHRLSAVSTSTNVSSSHHPDSYAPFGEPNELMVSFITSSATVTSTVAPTTSSQPLQQQSSSTSPSLLLTLGGPPRLHHLQSPSTSTHSQTNSSTSHSQTTPMSITQNGFTSTGSMSAPFIRILEQPINRIRYRYKSEKGSHGGMTGESSTQTKKTYPTIKLENYRSHRQVFVKASLYTNEEVPKPHIHKLMGKCCNEEGVCVVPLSENQTAIFQNLGILFVGKKEVPEIIFRQKLDEQRLLRALTDESNISEEEKQKLKEESDREAKRINLNSVRICFQAFDCNNDVHFPISDPVFSRPVANQKSPDSGELKIVRMDKYSGVCTGDEEVYLLCEKVNKKEIKVRFFEADTDGAVLWEAFGNFTEADVHHQVAIVFRTPPYRDVNIENAVQVYVQLFRPKDGEYSEPRPFTYRPKEYDKEGIDRRRKKVFHYSPSFSENNNYGGYSGHRYGAGTDGRGVLGNTGSTQGNGLNYYGQSNTQGYYRETTTVTARESRNRAVCQAPDVSHSLPGKLHSGSLRDSEDPDCLNYSDWMIQVLKSFTLSCNTLHLVSSGQQFEPAKVEKAYGQAMSIFLYYLNFCNIMQLNFRTHLNFHTMITT